MTARAMETVPSDEAQIGECAALSQGSILPALELADRRPLLGFLAPLGRDQVHLGHRFARGSSRGRTASGAMHVEHEFGERVELRSESFELDVGEVTPGGHHGPHLAQRQHATVPRASVRPQPGAAGIRRGRSLGSLTTSGARGPLGSLQGGSATPRSERGIHLCRCYCKCVQ